MNKKKLPEINAGSMADIAFLLLIFFLVTTTIEQDSGILRKLPKKENHPTISDIKEKNTLEIYINLKNEITAGIPRFHKRPRCPVSQLLVVLARSPCLLSGN